MYRRDGAVEADFFLSYAAFGNLNVSKYVEHAEQTLCEIRWDYHARPAAATKDLPFQEQDNEAKMIKSHHKVN